jgi:putative spermidine/putrescine transport system ATP-binding protein
MRRRWSCAGSGADDASPALPAHRIRAGIVTMNMVELRQVSKRYGTIDALSTVDLAIRKGEFVTLLGPSGSGKTTLLNLIAGMVEPSAGRVFIDGRDATDRPPSQRGLGMVFQNYALMPHMTVFENIAFPLRVRRMPGPEVERRVREVLELVQLPDIAARKPRELSGGQQQRVSLARCIVYNPSLILMDEPLGALDKKLREQMQLEIKRLHSALGITMINVTHDQDEALTMSDRIVLMNAGRIEQESAPEELYFHPRTVFAADFIGDANLFAGRVLPGNGNAGGTVRAEAAFGPVEAALPHFAIVPGERITFLIRPENVRLVQRLPDEAVNCAAGAVRDSIVLGGVVKHHITLAEGSEIVVQEPNHLRRSALAPGQSVRVAWNAVDCVALPGASGSTA